MIVSNSFSLFSFRIHKLIHERGLTLAVRIQLTDHHIGRMTDNGAQDTSNVTTQEADTGLLHRAVALFRLTQKLVDLLDGLFETGELGHRVGDLATPERIQPLVQTGDALLGHDLAPSLAQAMRIRWQCRLHTDLDRLPGTKRQIRQKLGRGTGAQVDQSAVRVGEQLVAVPVLENLVEAILARTLEGVTDESWAPSKENASETISREDLAPCAQIGLVDVRVDLTTAFDQIKRRDGGMSRACVVSRRRFFSKLRQIATFLSYRDLPQAI